MQCLPLKTIAFSNERKGLIYISLSEGRTFEFTYSEIRSNVSKICKIIKSLEVSSCESVLLLLPAIPETVFIILACSCLGIHYCLVSPPVESNALKRIWDEISPRMVFSASYYMDKEGKIMDYNHCIKEFINIVAPIPIVLIQRPLYDTCILQETLDFYTLYAYCASQDLIMEEGENFKDGSLFSIYQNMHRITKKTNQTKTLVEQVFRQQECEHGDKWLSSYQLDSVEGLVFKVYGPFMFGTTSVIVESVELAKNQYWQIIESLKVECFCGDWRIFEGFDKLKSSGECELESLGYFIMENYSKNQDMETVLNLINERSFVHSELDFNAQCYFERFFVKFKSCDAFLKKLEKTIGDELCSEKFLLLKLKETLYVLIADKGFQEKKLKVEEIMKKCALNYNVLVMQMEEEKELKGLRLETKRKLIENEGKNKQWIIENQLVSHLEVPKREHFESMEEEFIDHLSKKIKT